jgi:hypothetical protein
MRTFATALLIAGAPASAEEPKSFKEPGALEPWQEGDIQPGDRWMKMRIDVNERGLPVKCSVIESNIGRKDTRFWLCNAMMSQWRTEPIMKDGVAAKASVERMFLIPGRTRARSWEKARKEAKGRQ